MVAILVRYYLASHARSLRLGTLSILPSTLSLVGYFGLFEKRFQLLFGINLVLLLVFDKAHFATKAFETRETADAAAATAFNQLVAKTRLDIVAKLECRSQCDWSRRSIANAWFGTCARQG